MSLVVGICFRRSGKVYSFSPNGLTLAKGEKVIVETVGGQELGEVVAEVRDIPDSRLVAQLKPVVRVATEEDIARFNENGAMEKRAFAVCEEKIAEHGLPMKLIRAEYSFDRSQATFSFSADGRVDFRELVRDVASVLHTKVQLHQIGVRDEAKLIGGYGTCGRKLCCCTFLSGFDAISMKMAKDQCLFLNPAKFSGACGKLLCCLRFEHEFYKEAHEHMPEVGSVIMYNDAPAKVMDCNVIVDDVTLQTRDNTLIHVPAKELKDVQVLPKNAFSLNTKPERDGDREESPRPVRRRAPEPAPRPEPARSTPIKNKFRTHKHGGNKSQRNDNKPFQPKTPAAPASDGTVKWKKKD